MASRLLCRTGLFLAAVAKYALGIWIFGLIWFSLPFPGGSVLNSSLAVLWFAALVAAGFIMPPAGNAWSPLPGFE